MENYVANVIPHLQQWWPVVIVLAYLIGIAFAMVALPSWAFTFLSAMRLLLFAHLRQNGRADLVSVTGREHDQNISRDKVCVE